METLAIFGGKPVRKKPFPAYRVIGSEEKRAVAHVLDSGILSRFLGCWHKDFYGGPQIQALEKEWANYFGARYAVAVNSCTSGLYAAVGAAGIGPGDEVIVSPFTMSASATAALVYGAIPVFADIEEDYFCLDPKSVEQKITPRTKAIIVVDLFGLPYDAEAINKIARKHHLLVIEDCAQAPGALYKKKYAGTLADIGVYSLNYHKHIHCGEGGIVVTNNAQLAERTQLIRNHAEAVVADKKVKDISNMVGFNFRMTEIEAAITRCQLKKLKKLLKERQENCRYLEHRLSQIPCIVAPKMRPGCTHAYYVHPFKFKEEIAGFGRDIFIEAVKAELACTQLREQEGVLISCGYVKPLYLQPMYQKRIAFGKKGFPFNSSASAKKVSYRQGICPTAERVHNSELFIHELMRSPMSRKDLSDVATAFEKVWDCRKSLSKRYRAKNVKG
ncbi:MAG: DegT/DnrJ/EryC1/StrS family aminotransferase [Candidatus Omnitrophota bacterium]